MPIPAEKGRDLEKEKKVVVLVEPGQSQVQQPVHRAEAGRELDAAPAVEAPVQSQPQPAIHRAEAGRDLDAAPSVVGNPSSGSPNAVTVQQSQVVSQSETPSSETVQTADGAGAVPQNGTTPTPVAQTNGSTPVSQPTDGTTAQPADGTTTQPADGTGTQQPQTAAGNGAPSDADQQKDLLDTNGKTVVPGTDKGQAASEADGGKPVDQPQYLYDWGSGMSLADADKEGKHTPYEIMMDRYKWGQANDKPINWLDASYFNERDMNKTKAETDKEEKDKKYEDFFEHLGYTLASLGNFIGATRGAPNPQNPLDSVALTERQRKRREQAQALRNAYNKQFFENYWKQRADEQTQQRNENEKRKLDRLDEETRLKNRKQDWLEKYQQGILDDKAERRRIDEEYKNKKISLDERNTAIRELNAMTGRMRINLASQGSTTETTDERGRKKVVVRKPGTAKGQTTTKTGKTLGLGIGQ